MNDNEYEAYVREAVYAAAVCLLRQASDATEDGNGFPITDSGPRANAEDNEWARKVVAEVPHLTEAVTAFVKANQVLLAADDIPADAAGHNLILSANRHGTGFWDRGYPHGEELHEAAEGYSMDAEFALGADGEVAWLMVDDIVLADRPGWAG